MGDPVTDETMTPLDVALAFVADSVAHVVLEVLAVLYAAYRVALEVLG